MLLMPLPPMPLAAELISPNLHVALIHYPLGLLAVGVLIELFAFLWPRSTVRSAGRWFILLGALSAVPAAFSGIYALRNVARVDMSVDRSWADVKAASPVLSDPVIWHQLKTHTLYQSVATGVAVLAVVVWLGSGDDLRRTLHVPTLALLVLALGGMMVGAWFSGEAIYQHGTGVEPAWPQTRADSPPPPTRVEGWFPPVELHLVAAGTTVAVALAAIGLSFRQLATIDGLTVEPRDGGQTELVRSFNPNIEVAQRLPPLPAGRFWLVTFAVAVVTALGGYFVLARGADVFTDAHGHYGQIPAMLWKQIKPEPPQKVNRLLVHSLTGGAIVVVPLVLAGLARFAPRQRVALSVFTVLLVGAVAAQVWIGVLLLYDTPDGPINHFKQPAAEASPAAPPAS